MALFMLNQLLSTFEYEIPVNVKNCYDEVSNKNTEDAIRALYLKPYLSSKNKSAKTAVTTKKLKAYPHVHYQAYECSMQGCRSHMEDSSLVHLSFNSHPEYSLFAIFDGHNGSKAAQYLTKHLPNKLDSLQTLTDHNQIQQIILEMDKTFCSSQMCDSGSTIVFAIVRRINIAYEISIFWVGDSRAILIDKYTTNSFKELTCDHTPKNPNEKLRIETANGSIINNRIDGLLAVSRAFGDVKFKNNQSLKFELQRVTSILEHKSVFASHNDILVLFSDGLVECINNQQLIRLLSECLNIFNDPLSALEFLFDEILHGGSRDNMSVIMVNLGCGRCDWMQDEIYLSQDDSGNHTEVIDYTEEDSEDNEDR